MNCPPDALHARSPARWSAILQIRVSCPPTKKTHGLRDKLAPVINGISAKQENASPHASLGNYHALHFLLSQRPSSLDHVFPLAIGLTIDRACHSCSSMLGSRVASALSGFLPIRQRRAELGFRFILTPLQAHRSNSGLLPRLGLT